MWNPDRISARGPRGYDEVVSTPGDDEGDTEEGSGPKGGTIESLELPLGSDVGFCFWKVDFVGCRILYFDFPSVDVVVADAGIGTGVGVLDVSVELDKEEGTLMVDIESGSKGILAFPFNLAFSCAFANLNLAVTGVSVFSLDSLDEDSAGDDGRD